MKTFLLILGIILLFLAGVVGWQIAKMQTEEGNLGMDFAYYAGDVIGTKVGTTTTGVNFAVNAAVAGQSATTSYINKLGSSYDLVIYTLKALKASSTANAMFAFQGSNDQDCDTASSSTSIADMVLTGNINWFDLNDNIYGATQDSPLVNASSTILWTNPQKGVGKTVILDDMNFQCIKMDVSGSSTVLWAQIKIK